MGRVDDDGDAQRIIEARERALRQAAERTKEKAKAQSTFAQKMRSTADEQGQKLRSFEVLKGALKQELRKDDQVRLRSSDASEFQEQEVESEDAEAGFDHTLRRAADAAQSHEESEVEGQVDRHDAVEQGVARTERGEEGRQEDGQHHASDFQGRQGAARRQGLEGSRDTKEELSNAEVREEKAATKRTSDRGKGGASAAPDGRRAGGREGREVGERGQGNEKGKDEEKGQGGQGFAAFRLNPALMAPAPVAQPRVSAASERLRALANEIAQKIVQRVRVGTNKDGMAEFQIDLKSTVLAGLSMKVMGQRGRVRAHFQCKDEGVLKLLRDNADGLKAQLESRGLKLEELKIEAAA
jgi:hypothetical protein